jgi:hypothetical protein
MDMSSMNLVVKDLDAALSTYLKLFGTNNITEVLKVKGLNDGTETIDGYYLKTQPLNLGLWTPRGTTGRIGQFLQKNGEGIHHLTFQMKQDEFEQTYTRFKNAGKPVSDRITYLGRLSEAIFWLDESGEQGVSMQFGTKCYRGLELWESTNYLDSPKIVEPIKINEVYIRPRIVLNSAMVTVTESEKQREIWADILGRQPTEQGSIFTLKPGQVNDGRGNIFIPVRFAFSNSKGINLYRAINPEGPINKIMRKKGVQGLYHNLACYVTRDQVHTYFKQLEDAGFSMVDPKPALNTNMGNGNYFFFIHPRSVHGVLWEVVSIFIRGEDVKAYYDWSDTKIYLLPPDEKVS